MPGSQNPGITDATIVTGIDIVSGGQYSDPNVTTTTTADPGTSGTTLAVTSSSAFPPSPASGGFYIGVDNEIMLVTAISGTNWTVTRGQRGTTGVAHTIGVTVRLLAVAQRVIPVNERWTTFRGRGSTFRQPGIAGTVGQKLFTLHNATGSDILLELKKLSIDLYCTVVKAITVAPPILRLHRITVLPTNGSTCAKVGEDSALTSSANVTCLQGASADGTSSGTALTATIPASNLVTQEFAPRFVTAVGYEMFDRTTFLADAPDEVLTLRALEGVCLFADYTLATQNPVTDMWVVSARWEEYRI
jgi:hypothetical protein